MTRYEYILSLCKAIENFCDQEVAKDNLVFTYKKTNLRYAVERALYFAYANTDKLYKIHNKALSQNTEDKIAVSDEVEQSLMAFITKKPKNYFIITEKKILKNLVKKILRFILISLSIDKLIILARQYSNNIYKKESFHTLFFVVNERFVRFMDPIYNNLDTLKAFFTHDSKTYSYIQNQRIKSIKISRFLDRVLYWSYRPSLLKRFFLMTQYDLLYDVMDRIRPKKIVLVEGNVPAYEVVNAISKNLGIEVLCLQQGWSPIVHNGFRNLSFSKMLMWGEEFGNLIKRENPNQKFVTTGSFTVNKRAPKNIKAINTVALFFHGTSVMLPPETLIYFENFVIDLSNKNPNINLIIREHPSYKLKENVHANLEKTGRVKFMSPPDFSMDEVLDAADLSVSVYSTLPLESIAAGVIPIVLNITSLPKYFPDIDRLGAGIEVKNIEEAQRVVNDLIEHSEKLEQFKKPMQEFQKKFFAFDKDTAIKNIVREIS